MNGGQDEKEGPATQDAGPALTEGYHKLSRGKHLKQEDYDFIRRMDEAGAQVLFRTQEEYVEGLRIALDRDTLDPHTYRDVVKNGYRKPERKAREPEQAQQIPMFYTAEQIDLIVRTAIDATLRKIDEASA